MAEAHQLDVITVISHYVTESLVPNRQPHPMRKGFEVVDIVTVGLGLGLGSGASIQTGGFRKHLASTSLLLL